MKVTEIDHLACFKMKAAGRLLLTGLLALALTLGAWAPVVPAEGSAAPLPKALLVMAFGPSESLRAKTISDLQTTVETLQEYGFEVYLLDCWEGDGGVTEYPHHKLRRHLEDKLFNLVIYYGHGNNSRWAFCLPQDVGWASNPDTAPGWDEAVEFGDHRRHWQENIRLAPDAMIIMRHTCYSAGLEVADMYGGAPLLSNGQVLSRINEYSYTFLHPHTGIASYTAMINVGTTSSYLENLFRKHDQPIGELTVPDLSASHPPGDGYQLLTGPHYYLSGQGMAFRKNRYPGGDNHAVWGQPAWAGRPGLSITEVCGRVPGDENGDGDNTDLGEPCFPHDKRDVFGAEDTSYNFFPFLCIANPGAVDTWAEITFYDEDEEYLTIYREVLSHARITIDFNANRNLRNRNLAVRVRSVDGTPLLAERPMYFRHHGWMDGGSDAFGSVGGSRTWYFPEGYTSEAHPFMEYICLANFGDVAATGTMTLLREEGDAVEVDIEIPPGTRQTQFINAYLEGEVSVKVETDRPVVAERSVYFRYFFLDGGCVVDGGHTKAGITSLSDYWYFAEGHTGGFFEEWISLANPGGEEAVATLTFFTPGGKRDGQQLKLPPRSRRTVLVNDFFPYREDVSVRVEADNPIACERAMYFAYNGVWDDGHVSPGVTAPSREWRFAEGSAFPGINEYILLVNPGEEAASVKATYLLGPGEGTHAAEYRIAPGSRVTVYANAELRPYGSPSQVALELSSDQPIVAERAMYFDMGRGGYGWESIRGGHVSLGVNRAAAEWYFAEAYTGR